MIKLKFMIMLNIVKHSLIQAGQFVELLYVCRYVFKYRNLLFSITVESINQPAIFSQLFNLTREQ